LAPPHLRVFEVQSGPPVSPGSGFDVVVCYSGPMSYVFDQPNFALEVRLRVTRPNKHPGAFDAGPHIITVVGRD
jgi:hypothetical protein